MPLRRTEEPRGGTIPRSGSSEPLLGSPPASHCAPAVAVGEAAMETAYGQGAVEEKGVNAATAAAKEEEEEEDPVVAVERREKARMAAWKGFVDGVQGAAARKGGGTSSGEAAEQEGEKGKKKEKEKKKRRSWLPDPEKRWPVQGW